MLKIIDDTEYVFNKQYYNKVRKVREDWGFRRHITNRYIILRATEGMSFKRVCRLADELQTYLEWIAPDYGPRERMR